jgi:hypothetical protein
MGYGEGGYGEGLYGADLGGGVTVVGTGVYTVQNIMDRVRRLFGDESSVQIEQQDLFNWINDACREVVMQHENLLQTSTLIDAVAGQYLYDVPVGCFSINLIKFRDTDDPLGSYYALRFMGSAMMNANADGWQGNAYGTGVPQVFTRANAGQFAIFPAPESSRVGAIEVVYARYANDVTSLADPIDLPPYYHSYVEHFCMMKAYEMDENWDGADRKAQLVQSTINFNNGRESWFGRETFPTIAVNPEDY